MLDRNGKSLSIMPQHLETAVTKFEWRNEVGRGGERRVEAFISEELRFAYRKVGDPHIGIHGEIEIAKARDRTSTGASHPVLHGIDSSDQRLRMPPRNENSWDSSMSQVASTSERTCASRSIGTTISTA